jgi:molybdate transport system regulatory protein
MRRRQTPWKSLDACAIGVAMPTDAAIKALLQLKRGSASGVGPDRMRLLEMIDQKGSISAAAKAAGLSYKGAWDAVQALNNLFEQPLVVARSGGRSGGAASVSPAGLALIAAYRKVEAELSEIVGRLDRDLSDGGASLHDLAWSIGMKTSARNALRGVVSEVKDGAVNAEVVLDVSPGLRIVAIITRESVRELGLAPGAKAIALIKSTFVIVARGEERLKTSARNCLSGVVTRHERGAVNDEVVIEIAPGKTITATLTRESADGLGLDVGARAQALIKASHVILAVE